MSRNEHKNENFLLNILAIIEFFRIFAIQKKRNINLKNKSIMKTSKLQFLGYFAGASLRLYRYSTPKRVKCYLIPSSAPLADFRQFEISKDYALFLLAGKLV